MNANAILNKIQSDADEAAAALLKDAAARAEDMQRQTEKKIASAKEQTEQQAAQDALSARSRMARMAELEERKALLTDKRTLMDRAFQKALEQLNRMPEGQAAAFLRATVTNLADGDETVVAGSCSPYINQAFVTSCNEEMKKHGKKGEMTLSPEKREGMTGLLLQKGMTEVTCTFEAILDSQRLALEGDVAEVLFPAM